MPERTCGYTSRVLSSGAPRFRLRSLALPVYLPTFLFAVGQGAVLPAIPLFARELGGSVALAGIVVSLRGLGTMGFDVPAGVLVARLGEKWAMVAATLVLAVVALGAAQSPSVWALAALILLMGCAWAVWLLARLSYVAEVAPTEFRGRALSLLGGTNRIGNFAGPFIGGFASEAWGLPAAFYIQAILAGLACAALFFLAGDEDHARSAHEDNVYRRLGQIVRDNRSIFMTAGVATTSLGVLRSTRQAVIPLWGDHLGLNPAEIGVIFGISAAIDMTLFYPVGIVMDRWGRKWTGVPCLLILAAGLMLVPATSSLSALLAVGLLIGLGNGLGSGIVMTLGADFSPPGGRGEFLGVWRFVSDAGTAVGPGLLGLIAGLATLGTASVATGGLGIVGAAVMAFLMNEPLHMKRDSDPPAAGGG